VKLLEFNVPRNRNLKAVFHKDLQIHFRLPKQTPQKVQPAQTTPSLQYHYTTSPKVKKEEVKKKGSYTIVVKTK